MSLFFFINYESEEPKISIQHKDIPNAQLHEPKGINAATANKVYKSNGAASGSWEDVDSTMLQALTGDGGSDGFNIITNGTNGFRLGKLPHGSFYFVNTAAPTTITYPAVATKLTATSIAGSDTYMVTAGTNSRLTYTGATIQHFHIAATISLDQTIGANRDIETYIARNGAVLPSSTVIQTTVSGAKASSALHADVELNQNDYLELFVKNGGVSGDVRVYALYMFMMGMTGV